MLVLLLSACRSVGGSEGFPVSDSILLHEVGSESTEVAGHYERTYSGRWRILAWGGGDCTGYTPPPRPEGEGWEEREEQTDEQPSLCENLQEAGRDVVDVGAIGGPGYRLGLSVYIDDTPQAASRSWAILTECGPPVTESDISFGYSITEKVSEEIEEFSIDVEGEQAEVTFAVGSKLSASWTMPVCSIT
jgi:hypothetical protein